MKIKVIIHEAEEGGYWAEVPAISGCATQGETFDELLANLDEAVEGCLAVDIEAVDLALDSRGTGIAVWNPSAARGSVRCWDPGGGCWNGGMVVIIFSPNRVTWHVSRYPFMAIRP